MSPDESLTAKPNLQQSIGIRRIVLQLLLAGKEDMKRLAEVRIVGREILTIVQAAEYLQFHPDKVYRLVRSGHLPAAKIGKEWRIRRVDIEVLLDKATLKRKPFKK